MTQNQCLVRFSLAMTEEPHELLASTTQNIFQLLNFNLYYQGKMILFFITLILICKYMAMDMDLGNVELPNNVFKIWI